MYICRYKVSNNYCLYIISNFIYQSIDVSIYIYIYLDIYLSNHLSSLVGLFILIAFAVFFVFLFRPSLAHHPTDLLIYPSLSIHLYVYLSVDRSLISCGSLVVSLSVTPMEISKFLFRGSSEQADTLHRPQQAGRQQPRGAHEAQQEGQDRHDVCEGKQPYGQGGDGVSCK